MATLTRVLTRLAEQMAWFSGALFLLLAFYMAADSLSRTLGGPFTGVSDQIAALTLMLGATWPLAHGIHTGIHVRSDVLLPLLPPLLKRVFWLLAMIGLSLFAWLLAVQGLLLAYSSWEIGALLPQSIMEMRMDVPQAISAFGYVVFAVSCTVITLKAALDLLHPPAEDSEEQAS